MDAAEMTKGEEREMFRRHHNTNMIIERLSQTKEGDIVTYREMNEIIKGNIQGKHRSYLETARRRLLIDKRMVFSVVRDIGVKRALNEEIPGLVKGRRGRAQKQIKKGGEYIDVCDAERLPETTRLEFYCEQTYIGMSRVIFKPKIERKIEQMVIKENNTIEPKLVMGLFTNGE